MNKAELAAALARQIGSTKADTEMMVNATFKMIADALASGGKVRIDGFGTFEVKNRAPRTGRNPKENLPVKIPACRVPVFKAHKALKDFVDCSRRQGEIRGNIARQSSQGD